MSTQKQVKITVADATKIAKLARLELDDAKLQRFADQCNDILDYMEKLGELDTSKVEPLYSPSEHGTVYREDVALARCTRDDILANAPESDGRFFIVPKIV